MLALDENSFDQDTANGGGGWRAIAAKDGCDLVAADLISDYRREHRLNSTILFWHEGQLRAFAGQTERAIDLFKKSYKPDDQGMGWNLYADATVAFLLKDRLGLENALIGLRNIPAPKGMPLRDGKIEAQLPDGTKTLIKWPLNLDVVEGFERCFDKSYREAYGSKCRQ